MASSGLAALTSVLAAGRRVRTVGLGGAARAWVLAGVHRRLEAPLVCVTADEESADALAGDLAFFFGTGTRMAPTVVRLPGDEVLPWDELVPDQAVVADRLQALPPRPGHAVPASRPLRPRLGQRLIP
jgi:transcription-repair coupling factor (superfamily II helicase)